MFAPKYLVVQRDHVSRGLYIESRHWLRWRAEIKARHLTEGYARAHAIRAAWFIDSQAPRFTWEVDTRCK